MRTYSKKQYDEACRLRSRGFGAKRASNKLNIPKGTVDGWYYKEHKPFCISTKFKESQEKNKKNLEFGRLPKWQLPDYSKKLSTNLAYLCGVILGDGHIHKNGYRIELLVKDKDFAESFKTAAQKWCGIKPKMNKNRYFVVSINSVCASKFISNNFDAIIKNITKIDNEEIIISFLKGLYDSEGSAYYDKKRGISHLSLRMTDRHTIDVVKLLLNKIGIKYSFYIKKRRKDYKTVYEISIQRRSMQRKFLDKIGFSIRRKQDILEEFCNDEILRRSDKPKHPWFRKDELKFIKEKYPGMNTRLFINEMNKEFWNGSSVRSVGGIYYIASKLGIKKEMNK